MLTNCAFGSTSVKISGIKIKMKTAIAWAPNESATVQLLFVFPTPSTKVCLNISAMFCSSWAAPLR
jgi:hypothetical protein